MLNLNLEFAARDSVILLKTSVANGVMIIELLFEAVVTNNLLLSSLLGRRAAFLSPHATKVTVYLPIVATLYVISDIFVKFKSV